jgi:uncharacterized protein (TIGR00730 family)
MGAGRGPGKEEYEHAANAFGMRLDRICVYCGSSDAIADPFKRAAAGMGRAIANKGITLVYGGGGRGMMGALADAALAAGGQVIGVLPRMFDTPALAHRNLSEVHIVDTMHERKAMMAALADGFIALPGGFGTFEELFEMLTWAQIGLHRHPIGLLNAEGYFDSLTAMIEHAAAQGFIYGEHRRLVGVETDADRLLEWMASFEPPARLERWVDRGGESA